MNAVKVRPLTWKVCQEPAFRLTYHTADVGLGRYYQIVEPPPGTANGFALWTEAKDMEDPPCGTVNGTGYTTLDAAKAVAQAEWEAFVLAAIEPPATTTHGVNCPKAPHEPNRTGYLHEANDNAPYDVDGVRYCGRCHEYLLDTLSP